MSAIDYKSKYENLKAKYMNTVDTVWRLGYEQGLKDAQAEQAQMQAQAAQAQPGMGQEGAPQDESQTQEGQMPKDQGASGDPKEDELGEHIEKLESMLGKSEISAGEIAEIKKTLNDIKSLQTSINLAKSMENVKNVKMSPKLKANLSIPVQKSISMQEKIITDIFKKWDSSKEATVSEISGILNVQGLTKKE